jgi:hypothetical protein
MKVKKSSTTAATLLASFLTHSLTPAFARAEFAIPLASKRLSQVPRPFVLEIGANRMTASLRDAPIRAVADLLAEKGGVRVMFHGLSEESVTAELKNETLEEGIRRLFQGRNLAYFYATADGRKPGRLVAVLILGTSEAEYGGDNFFSTPHVHAQDNRGGDGTLLAKGEQALPSGELAQLMAESQDSAERERAAAELGKTWTERAVNPLTGALAADPSASVREAAAGALGKTWSESAVQPLIEALAGDRDGRVREQAARALAQTAGEEAVPALAEALERDRRWFVREAAALALGTIGGRDALEALMRASRGDRDAWVREAAAMAALDSH